MAAKAAQQPVFRRKLLSALVGFVVENWNRPEVRNQPYLGEDPSLNYKPASAGKETSK